MIQRTFMENQLSLPLYEGISCSEMGSFFCILMMFSKDHMLPWVAWEKEYGLSLFFRKGIVLRENRN